MTWHLEETRQHINRLFGREQLELAKPCIRSVVDRQMYARIHYQDAHAKIDAYVSAELQELSLLDVTFGDGEAWGEFNVFIRTVAAHLTACVQSVHAVPDILSHVLYFSLGLNRTSTALRSRDVNVATVLKLLKTDSLFSGLHGLLEGLVLGGSFKHLAALANQAKHRSIVFPTLSEDWTGEREERHAVVFPSFAYEGVVYPQVAVRDLLEPEYERSSRAVVETGQVLNALLRRRMP